MRPIWSGGISFGLIFIPVRLYSAIETVTLDLDMLDEKDKSPINYKRVNESTGKEVPWKNIVKGYEYEKGEYVVLEEEDFKKANVDKAENIEIVNFVDAEDIDPKFFEKPYYLEPAKNAKKTYALLREALKKSNKVGLAEFVLRDREHLVALQPEGDVLLLNQMRYPSEIRPHSQLDLPGDTNLEKKELDLAIKLIEEMSSDFKPKQFKDDYIDELKKVIEAKAKHHRITTPKAKKHKATEIPELMDQLRKSLESLQIAVK
jgi:DNA end-binding protein Ku